MDQKESNAVYWRLNIRLVCLLLLIWFTVSYGCGILFVDVLNTIKLPGTAFPLGFWFAQQGSIFIFVALIFIYSFQMNKLDRQYGVAE